MSFVFFDTETTGLKPGFDQIVQFAAIRTDPDLRETGRFEAHSHLLPNVLPHPVALLTNGLPIADLIDPRRPSHYEMVRAIRQKLLSWSPAIFLGYNSMRFDEEMLRHALFQTLHPAYLTSNHNNSRADVWGLVMAAAAISPACLNVPLGPEGRTIFRLEQLASANKVVHERPHQALSDVTATLELCRLVRQRSPELWQRFIRFSKKATVAEFVDAEDGFILTEFFANQAYHTPVVCIGRVPDQVNARLCLTLTSDVNRFAAMTDDQLAQELALKPCPVRRLRVNAAPTLTALYDAPDIILREVNVDVDTIEARARRVKGDGTLRERLLSNYLASREPRMQSPHVEGRLYDAFPEPEDDVRMEAFHSAEWTDRLKLVHSFKDQRLRLHGLRLLYVEARSILPDSLRDELALEMSNRLIDEDAGGMTIERALREIAELSPATMAEKERLIEEYQTYLIERLARVTDFRTKQLPLLNS